MSVVFTIFFDGQFCVGVLEVWERGTIRAARHVFGAEPTDAQVAQFCAGPDAAALLARAHAAPAVPAPQRAAVDARNPKRLARQAARAMRDHGLASRSQRALGAVREAEAAGRQAAQRAEAERRRRESYELAKAKRRAHHRGRG